MDTRVEIFRNGLWRKLKLQDGKAVKYNALLNKIGTIASRDISHTNTFDLPDVFQNTSALGVNSFNKKELAKSLNSKYPAKYYVEDKLMQQGYLVINNTYDGVINVNFIDEALSITEKWRSITFNELITSEEYTKPTDYASAITEMTNYLMDKESVLPHLSEVGTRGYQLALYPNNLNSIGDKFQVSHVDDGFGDITEIRLDNSFNPYQNRPIFNAKALFDLAVETFGYTSIFDDSVDWDKISKLYIIGSGLDQNKKSDEGRIGITYPGKAFVDAYEKYSWSNLEYEDFAFSYPPSIQVSKPIDDLLWTHPYSPPFDLTGIKYPPGYEIQSCVFKPNTDQSVTGNVKWQADINAPANYVSQKEVWGIWKHIDGVSNNLVKKMTIIEDASTVSKLNFSVDKAEILTIAPGFAGDFIGYLVFARAVDDGFQNFVTSRLENLVVSETYLPENVVSYDEFGQYVSNAIDLTHAAPRKSIQDLLIGIMQKEGILMNIDGRNKIIKFFSYGEYENNKNNGVFRDWSNYFQKYTKPIFNTDYGNNYAKNNELGLSSPYVGNTYKLTLENQGADSKYKEFTENKIAVFKDIEAIDSIQNSFVPYFEYTNKGLGLVEDTGTRLSGLTQISADGSSQGILNNLPAIANVNYTILPQGMNEWYKLIDQAIRVEAQFLLPVDEIKDLNLSQPIFIEGLGGYYIIEEIAEYENAQTPVNVKLIKLIDGLVDGINNPAEIIDLVANYDGDSSYQLTLEKVIPGVNMYGNQNWLSSYSMQLSKQIQSKEISGNQSWSTQYGSMNLSKEKTYKDIEGNQDWNSTHLAKASLAVGINLNLQQVTDNGWVTTNPIQAEYVITKYIDFDTTAPDAGWKEGRAHYDNVNKCITIHDDIEGTSLQVGQEVRIRVFNDNGTIIPNGAPVTVVGVLPGGAVKVEKAIASDKISALNTVGIATHDIPVGEYGWATTSGIVNDVDTSSYPEGAALWLSDSVAGTYQTTRPISPSYEVRMGGVVSQNSTTGKIYAELRIIDNDHDNNSFFNGAVLEPNKVIITSNGTTVNCSLISLAANNRLSLIFNQNYVSVASGINIDLTLGTDSVPLENWVYIDTAGVIQKSTTGFPTGIQYTPVARVVVPSATRAQTYGCYKVHAYTDHLAGSNKQGHLSHLNDWVRKRPAAYQSGIILTQSVSEGTAAATIDLSYSSGNVSQLHDHTFPAYNTATKPAFVINNLATPYRLTNGIDPAIQTDSLGNSIGNNKYYNIVVWGVVSEATGDCKIFFNLPSGSYSNVTDAINDIDNTTDYTIPSAYLGTGFLLDKFTIKRTSTTVTVEPGGTRNLRGSIPAVGGGSVIGGGTGITLFDELSDTPISKVGSGLFLTRVNVGETALEYVNPTSLSWTESQISDLQAYLLPSDINVSVQPYNANTVIDSAYVHTDNNYTTTEKNKLSLIEAGAEVNVNADWNSISGDSEILNKPILNISNWNTAFGWGDHSTQGYLTSVDLTNVAYTNVAQTFTAEQTLAYVNPELTVRSAANVTGSISTLKLLNSSNASTNLGIWLQSYRQDSSALFRILNSGVVMAETDLSSNFIFTNNVTANNLSGTNTGDQDLSSYDTHIALVNEHKNWTLASQGVIHPTNYVDNDTIYDDTAIQAEVDLNTGKVSFPGFTSLLADYGFTDNSLNWNLAFGWGDHSLAGYLTSFSETDPVFTASAAAGILSGDISNWNTAHGWGDHSLAGYLTSETSHADVLVDGDFPTNGIMTRTGSGTYAMLTDNSANWNTAYGWGDHSTQGYLTEAINGIITQDEGVLVDSQATTLNFVGTGVSAVDSGLGVTTVTVSAGDANGANIRKTFTSQTSVIFTHNTGEQFPSIQCWDNTNEVVIPKSVVATNSNTCTVTFHEAVTGTLVAVVGGTVGTLPNFVAYSNVDNSFSTAQTGISFNGITGLAGNGVATTASKSDHSHAIGEITGFTDNSTNWNLAFGWGDHSLAGYLTSFSETDPVFTASAAAGILSGDISNWNTAHGWGDHSLVGYLVSADLSGYLQTTDIGNTVQGYNANTTLQGVITLSSLGYTGATDADNYSSWNLKTNGVQRTTVQSGGTLDLVQGTNITLSYGAGGIVTINSTAAGGGATQLNELTDVTSALTTNKFVLVANGSSYVGRSLLESDISDFGSYELAFAKNTAFNKNFGTAAGTVSEGNHNHSGVYEPADATILKEVDINVTIQKVITVGITAPTSPSVGDLWVDTN